MSHATPPSASSSSHLTASNYASRRKDLLAVVNQLRSLGAQGELDLPRIVIIGNQSAGKSSVVEAISGINLPRDAGTCTRAPIECRLTSSEEPWSCQIYIREEYGSTGKRLDEVKNKPFGRVITNKADVEDALRRAQFAVLNPKVDHQTILKTSIDSLSDLSTPQSMSFSRNVVCVDLKGPDLTDLAFIDLPGIIQNADDETVSLVEEMVVSHIDGNCLILVALPMTDDIENQKALRLARQADVEGSRTIGVLTKPDMLGAGSLKALELWNDVIEGRRHPLQHGYYVTRQLNDAERTKNVTPAEARRLEESFFMNTQPWSKSRCAGRFGTKSLSNALSMLLMNIINDSLPRIKQETEQQLKMCKEELSHIPARIEEDPVTYILNAIIAFAGEFQGFVQGGSANTASLIQSHKTEYEKFKVAVRKTAPNFVPFHAGESADGWDENFEDGSAEDTPQSTQRPFNLTAMRNHIKKSMTRELPNNVPFEAKVALIRQFQAKWQSAAINDCYRAVKQLTLQLVMRLVQDRFQRHHLLLSDVKSSVSKLFSRHDQRCLMFLEAALEMEMTPATQNNHYLQSSTEKWHAKYKSARTGTVPITKSAYEPPKLDGGLFNFNKGSTDSPFAKPPPLPTPAEAPTLNTAPNPASAFGAKKPPTNSGSSFAEPTSYNSVFANTPSGSSNSMFALSGSTSQPLQKSAIPFSFESFKPATPASSTPSAKPNTPEPLVAGSEDANELLAMLAKHGYYVSSLDDLAKLKPGDEYETELLVMAEVRGYFQVSYKRIIDNIPGLIDLRFLKELGKELQPFLVKQLGLGTAAANEKCAEYLTEDRMIIAKRNELEARQARLESVQGELNNFQLRLDGALY
ncbi:hypothetical protein PM082_006900 [Marasmius tenuissimus]|nr:hypothetical protein PM082_006900 [Marasmius tenuissimus]